MKLKHLQSYAAARTVSPITTWVAIVLLKTININNTSNYTVVILRSNSPNNGLDRVIRAGLNTLWETLEIVTVQGLISYYFYCRHVTKKDKHDIYFLLITRAGKQRHLNTLKTRFKLKIAWKGQPHKFIQNYHRGRGTTFRNSGSLQGFTEKCGCKRYFRNQFWGLVTGIEIHKQLNQVVSLMAFSLFRAGFD